jgi:uncharacterized protein YkwD
VYPYSAGYRPAQLAALGVASYAAGLLLPALQPGLVDGTLLSLLGVWLVIAAYTLYAVNIHDLRGAGPRITAILMLAVPLAAYWYGGQFLLTIESDPTAAAISLAAALALGAIVSLGVLWTLGTVRRGALRLLHRHERRRRSPSFAWVAVSLLVVSLCAISSTTAIPDPGDPIGVIQRVSGTLGATGPVQIPGIAMPTTRAPTDGATPAITSAGRVIAAYTPAADQPGAADPGTIEQTILLYTNQERQQQGLPVLAWDASLAAIARAHSTDMAEHGFFSHTNPAGQDPTARAVAAGYSVRRDLGGLRYSLGIGENIGKMPTGNVVGHGYVNNDPESIARATVQAWMESPGHRENILNAQYARIGIGVAYDGTYYFGTQDFI